MLRDLQMVEAFYGPGQLGLFLSDVIRHYGALRVLAALRAGEIVCRRSCLSPQPIVMLTPNGRAQAV